MDLTPHVDELHRQLAVSAQAGGEAAQQLAEHLAAPLDAAIRLMLLEALSAAVSEITRELAPGSVELRLRGRDPEFVVSAPAAEPVDDARTVDVVDARGGEDGTMTRINLRLPDQLKTRIEQAAEREGLSINAWLVRAAAGSVERGEPRPDPRRRPARGGEHFQGWAR